MSERLFSGIYPTGIMYADRTNEVNGDYKRLAFLPYKELELEVEKDCPADLRTQIEQSAAKIIARRGERFQISGSSNQSVILGE